MCVRKIGQSSITDLIWSHKKLLSLTPNFIPITFTCTEGKNWKGQIDQTVTYQNDDS